MRVLILGATGMLGYQLFKTCVERNIAVNAVVRSTQLLKDRMGAAIEEKLFVIDDAKNIEAIENVIKKIKPDYLINCIGIIKQSSLAENHYESIAINSFLPHQLERMGSVHNFRLIHISTDCVFDGTKGMYKETDRSDAYDLYGKSKFLGEVGYGSGLTIRTSIIGHEITTAKHGLLDWFLSQTGTIKGFTKAIFSGLTTYELTKVILDVVIAKKIPAGLYQVPSEPISKFDLLMLAKKIYKKEISILPSEELVIDRSLDGSHFFSLTDYQVPSWEMMLEDSCEDLKK